MARPRKIQDQNTTGEDMTDETTDDGASDEIKGDFITYTPGPHDPTSVKWAGITFHANVPKMVNDADHLERARSNKFFKVGEFTAADAVATRDEAPSPKTSDQYRAHAVAWFKTMQSVDDLDRKWQAEETLRMSCGVGMDDIEYLAGLSGPLRAELRKRDMG